MRYISVLILAGVLAACSGDPSGDEAGDFEPIRITADDAQQMSMTDIADQLISDSQSLTGLLTGVNNAETAEAIRPEIETMIGNYQLMVEQFDAMGEPSFSEMASLASRLPDLANTQQALASEVERIYKNHPEATEVLRDTLENVRRAPAP